MAPATGPSAMPSTWPAVVGEGPSETQTGGWAATAVLKTKTATVFATILVVHLIWSGREAGAKTAMKAETIKGDRLLPDCSEAYAIESPEFKGDNWSREVWPKLERMSNGRVTGVRLVQHKGANSPWCLAYSVGCVRQSDHRDGQWFSVTSAASNLLSLTRST